jgi:transposase
MQVFFPCCSNTTPDPANKRLDLFLAFERGARFICPECGAGEPCPVHDTKEWKWRHLDFFRHRAYLTAKVPRELVHNAHRIELKGESMRKMKSDRPPNKTCTMFTTGL